MKVCCICKEEKEESEFYWKKINIQRHYSCKVCYTNSAKRRHAENKTYRDKLALRNAILRKRNMEFVDNFKKDKSCIDCGNNNPIVLDFDHLSNKLFNIARLRRDTCSIKTLEKEISKCEIICANCHRIRTYNRRNGSVVK